MNPFGYDKLGVIKNDRMESREYLEHHRESLVTMIEICRHDIQNAHIAISRMVKQKTDPSSVEEYVEKLNSDLLRHEEELRDTEHSIKMMRGEISG